MTSSRWTVRRFEFETRLRDQRHGLTLNVGTARHQQFATMRGAHRGRCGCPETSVVEKFVTGYQLHMAMVECCWYDVEKLKDASNPVSHNTRICTRGIVCGLIIGWKRHARRRILDLIGTARVVSCIFGFVLGLLSHGQWLS